MGQRQGVTVLLLLHILQQKHDMPHTSNATAGRDGTTTTTTYTTTTTCDMPHTSGAMAGCLLVEQ